MANSIPLHSKYGVNPTIPICVYCGEKKNQVVLLGNNYKDKAPSSMIVDNEPCDKCKEQMAKGLTIVEFDSNDSKGLPNRWVVIDNKHIEDFLSHLNIPDKDKEFIRKKKFLAAELGFIKHVFGDIDDSKTDVRNECVTG